MKFLIITILTLRLLPPAFSGTAPEALPQAVMQDEVSSVRDRLSSSLFFRGELADKIIEAGLEGSFIDLAGIETNAGARNALLGWIQKNPAKAAGVYLGLKGGGERARRQMETQEISWEFNPSFIAAVKALNAAAGNSSVSRETMELAARRLYEGPQAQPEGPEVRIGGQAAGSGFFSINYADYRLNRAGLEREVAQAGAWLEAARGAGSGINSAGAFSTYSEFVVAAAALKGRQAVTEQESRRLEVLRVKLRSAMAALALRERASALAAAGGFLKAAGAEPGAGELLASATALGARLEFSAAALETGGLTLRELGKAVNSAENEFAALYLGYTVYNGLLGLKSKAARPAFSCFYDYAIYRYLSAFFPETAYPRARQELAVAAGPLDAALFKAGTGDLSGALSGLEPKRLEAAAGVVRSSSVLNRGAQFFLWGLFFRPVEYKISVSRGRAAYRPAFTFFEVVRPR